MSNSGQYHLKKLPQKKPLMIFDGDCFFCRTWIQRWRQMTGPKIDYVPYQDNAVDYPEIPIKEFQKSVQLITPEGNVYGGARAVFEALSISATKKWPLWLYQNVIGVGLISEIFYSLVAKNRPLFSWLTRLAWGPEVVPTTFFIPRWFFLKGLGLVYAIAFASLGIQILGLVGSEGVLPANSFLTAVSERYGSERFFLLPTLFWLTSSDLALQVVCWLGVGLSFVLILGYFRPLVLILLWSLYLSLFTVGRNFLGFQWDILLLEVGFLSIFLVPLQLKPNIGKEPEPAPIILFLLKLLFFKLMFSSGLVKLLSGDQTWHNFTALNFHYETQPLPAWTSWYVHQLPEWFHKASVLGMFGVELILPFFIFAPRRIRYVAAGSQIFLQLLIIGTGNYCFFNLLTILLALLLFDDTAWPMKIRKKFEQKRTWSSDFPSSNWPKPVLVGLCVFILSLTAITWPSRLGMRIPWPGPMMKVVGFISSFHFVNNYGLFAVMTTKRPEIIVQGSYDGQSWRSYEFKFKPGDVSRRPMFVAPHQPRLDWQMWFASLGSVQQNPWFVNFCLRLLQGSEPVLNLLEKNPFPDNPPRIIRAMMYDYRFTDSKQEEQTGFWWRRDSERVYLQPISLRGS